LASCHGGWLLPFSSKDEEFPLLGAVDLDRQYYTQACMRNYSNDVS